MDRSPSLRASRATRGKWSPGCTAWNAPARSPTSPFRPRSGASRCACSWWASSSTGWAARGNSSPVGRSCATITRWSWTVPLGSHSARKCHSARTATEFTVVGLTQDQVTSAGDPVAYITLLDAQELQFERAPPVERREAARGGPSASTDIINVVVARVSPYLPVTEVAAAVARWKHLSALTQAQQETLVSKFVIEKQRKQIGMFMVLLVIVSAVIIALIVYTLTMDKLRSIATLKLIGAPDRTIIGLIVQQALSMGIVGFLFGLALVEIFKDYFPRRVILLPDDVAVLFTIVVVVCLAASGLAVRAAVRVDPARALVV